MESKLKDLRFLEIEPKDSDLKDLYVNKGYKATRIAKLYNCDKTTVYRYLKRYNIALSRPKMDFTIEPSARQEEIIYGTLLGDGCIPKDKNSLNSSLEVFHGHKQRDYLDWKYTELATLCRNGPKIANQGRGFRIRTFHNEYFSKLKNIFYKNGRKVITEEILQRLTPLSIAIWFMDDGTNIANGSHFRFATCGFNEQEHLLMQEYFKNKYNIRTKLKIHSGYRLLAIHNEDRGLFIELISPYIIDSMIYKIKTKVWRVYKCKN